VHLEKQFDVTAPRQAVAEVVAREDTLPALFPQAKSEIVERRGNRRTLRTHYRALGRDGTATFHFDELPDGGVQFEKICDGRVWKELTGSVSLVERGARTRVRIVLDGCTKTFVPEFTIRVPMQEQLDQMATALRELFEK
jgi:carbon monoxide dehydrogenase subunit G